MKNFFILLSLSALLCACQAESGKTEANTAPAQQGQSRQQTIIDNIARTNFPDYKYDVSPLMDDSQNALPTLQEAIDRVSFMGGGTVRVRKGNYLLCGSLHLKSNVCIDLADGAYLRFSGHPSDYLPEVFTRWEGTEMYGYSPFIYAYHCNNIAITGHGTIDGQAGSEMADWANPEHDLEDADSQDLVRMCAEGAPVQERRFGQGRHLRPSMIQMIGCSRVLIEGVSIKDSPFWVIHPVYCDNVVVREVNIKSNFRNSDGCVAESSSNVLIERCSFLTGDDSVAIKSGRNAEGRSIARASENIVIRNCLFSSEQNGLCIGSEVSGGVSSIYMDSIRIEHVGNAIYFKSNSDRGGYIRDVWVNNVTVVNTRGAVVRFDTDYFDYTGRGHYLSEFRGFHIKNIFATKSEHYGIFIDGQDDCHVQDVEITNFNLAESTRNYHVIYGSNIVFNDCVINGQKLPTSPIESETRQQCDVW